MRSTSRLIADGLIDQIVDSAIHTPSAPMSDANATRSRPGTVTRSRISSTVVGTRNASATQPQDCEKYAPSLAFAAVTIAATAAATMSVRPACLVITLAASPAPLRTL